MKTTAVDRATEFLKDFLKDGPRLSKAVEARGKAKGHSRRTLQRAATGLGISQKDGTIFQTLRGWHWQLPGVNGNFPLHFYGRPRRFW